MIVRLPARSGRKIVGSSWRPEVPLISAPKRSDASADPDGRVAPEQRRGEPDEADRARRDVELAEPVLPARDVERAAEPGERAGDRHREEVVAGDRDAAVARRLRVEPDRAHLEAERRPVDDEPVDDEHRERDEDPDREALQQLRPPEDRQLGAVRRCRSRPGSTPATCSAAGPCWPNRYAPTQIAIQLSMIVVITSCAPTVALRMPAIPA